MGRDSHSAHCALNIDEKHRGLELIQSKAEDLRLLAQLSWKTASLAGLRQFSPWLAL